MKKPHSEMSLIELQLERDRIRNEMHALQPAYGTRIVASETWPDDYELLAGQAAQVKNEFDQRGLGHLCPRFFWR